MVSIDHVVLFLTGTELPSFPVLKDFLLSRGREKKGLFLTNLLLPVIGSLLQLPPPRCHHGLVDVVGLTVSDPFVHGAVSPREDGDREPHGGQVLDSVVVVLVASPVNDPSALAMSFLMSSPWPPTLSTFLASAISYRLI